MTNTKNYVTKFHTIQARYKMNGITKLEISKFSQWSQARPLENAWHAQTGECSEIENENNLFVREDGELYKASDELVEWYRKAYYNSLADDICIILNHDNQTAFIADDPDEYHDTYERKWHRFKVTLYHKSRQLEFTAFGEEYRLDEIKDRADELIEKYVGKKTATWYQNENTHSKAISDYSVEIYVIP